jgi:hypothetical protein
LAAEDKAVPPRDRSGWNRKRERVLPMLGSRLRHVALPSEPEVEEFPLEVVPDWDAQVSRANRICRLIDRHLNYEARSRLLHRLEDFEPRHLYPEQRVQLVSDLRAVRR